MDIIAFLYVASLILGFAAVLILGVHSLRFSHYPGGRMFLLYTVTAFITLSSFTMLAISPTPDIGFFWARLRFLGLAASPPVYLLFVLDYTGKNFRGKRVVAILIFIFPVLTQLVLWSDRVLPAFFTFWSLRSYSFLVVEHSQFGLWFQFHSLYAYGLLIVAYYCILSSLSVAKGGQRPALMWILLGNLLTMLVSMIPGVVGNTLPLNVTPFGITGGLIILGWGLFRHRLFDLRAAAYHTVFLSFQDAVLVVNGDGEIIQWNPTAEAVFGKRVSELMYAPLNDVLAVYGVPVPLLTTPDAEFELTLADRIFNTRVSALRMSNGFDVGRVLVLRDITVARAAEITQREAERSYRLLAENSTDMIALHTLDGQFVYVSPSSLHFTGYSERELLRLPGQTITEFVYPDDLPTSFAYYLRLANGDSVSAIELRLMKKDGTHFWAEVRATPIYDARGQLIHMMSVVRNIDERKHIEEALRESHRRYDTLVSNIPAMVYQVRRTLDGEMRFDYVSPTSTKYVGLTPQAIIEDPSLIYNQIDPAFRESLEAAEAESLRSLTPLGWEGRGVRDGQAYWMHLESIPLRLDDGTVLWNGVHLDITAQKQAEQELERSRKMIEHIARTLPDVIHVYDLAERKSIYHNQMLRTLLGYDEAEFAELMSGNYLQSLMHPDDYALERQFGDRYVTLQDDAVLETEYRWQHKTKGSVWLNVREVVYERAAEGKVKQILGVIRDVTTRKTAEEQNRQLLLQLEAANQELKDFAYVISHDLRAPLRGVSSIAHWLITRYGSVFDKDGQELIDLLGGRVRRMEQMINGVLEYSRIGRDKATLSQVDLATVIPQIVLDIVPTDRMTVLIEGELPTVNVEATRIRQVFQNLIDNAVKFMDKPQGEIQIGCLPDEALWCFYVRDNGCGIPAEHFDRIFQLFQTLQPKDQQESTGVGLALTKRIIEQYGGKIWVKSTVSVGTTFFFTLPRGAQTDQSSG